MSRAVRRMQAKEARTSEKAARNPMRSGGQKTPTSARAAAVQQARNAWYKPRFLMDIISELRKVIWPTRQDVWHLTVVIVIVTIIIGAILGAIDISFGWIIDKTVLS